MERVSLVEKKTIGQILIVDTIFQKQQDFLYILNLEIATLSAPRVIASATVT